VRKYLARRLMLVIPTVLGVTMIIFIAMRLLPGDPWWPSSAWRGETDDPEQRANLEQALGLRDPVVVQYWQVAPGHRHRRIRQVVAAGRQRHSVRVAPRPHYAGDSRACDVALLDGRLSGRDNQRPQTQYPDGLRQQILLYSVRRHPRVLAGLVAVLALILWFDYKAPILPVYPWRTPGRTSRWSQARRLSWASDLRGSWRAWSALLSSKSYRKITSGRRGQGRARATGHCPTRPSQRDTPVITWSSLFLGVALGGSVAVEKAFGVPGLGLTMIDAILDRDLPVVQNLVLLYVVFSWW